VGFFPNWTGFWISFRLLGLQQFASSHFHFLIIAEPSTSQAFHRIWYRCSEEVEWAIREWLPMKVPHVYNGGSFKLLSVGENVCLYFGNILKISDVSGDWMRHTEYLYDYLFNYYDSRTLLIEYYL